MLIHCYHQSLKFSPAFANQEKLIWFYHFDSFNLISIFGLCNGRFCFRRAFVFVVVRPRIDLGIAWISFVWKKTTNWSRKFLNQFCLKKKEPRIDLGIFLFSFVWKKKNHGLISEFLESVLFEKKEQRIDLGISWISFVLKRTTNCFRNFLNQFCFKKNHEMISEFPESVLF